jgi:hypothetical protein
VAVSGDIYSSGFQGPVWLDSVHCGGSEKSLANCGHDAWGESDLLVSQKNKVTYLFHRRIKSLTCFTEE